MSHPVSPDVHRLVADAIAAIRSGDKARGQKLLMQALRINPHHEVAWLWMASLVETPERRRECLERALAINPHNEIARRALQALPEPQPSRALHDAGAPDKTFHPSPTSVHEYVQTATQANGAQDDQARHCPHCGAPLETTATFCAFCKSPLALPSASDAPSYSKHPSLTDEERKRLETDKNTENRRRLDFVGYILLISVIFMLLFLTSPFITGVWIPLLLTIILISPILLTVTQQLYHDYQIEKLLKKATVRVECPVLEVWKAYDDEKDDEISSFFVAWELMATDQHGQPLRLQQAQKICVGKSYNCFKTLETVRVRYAPEQPNISILDEEWVAAIQKSIHV